MAKKNTHEAEAVLTVNAGQAQKTMEELREEAELLKKQFKAAADAGDKELAGKLNNDLVKVQKSMQKLRTKTENIEAAMKSLDKATPKELQKTIRLITSELNSGKIERGSREWDILVNKLKLTKEELAKVNQQMSAVKPEGMFKKMFKSFSDWWGIYTIFTDAIEGVSMKLSAMKKQFRDKGESQANLKALTGLDDESVQWLTAQAEQLSQTMDETGLRVTQSSKEILDAYMLVGSNKPELLSDKEALNAVTIEIMRLSAASKMKLAPAVDATTTALNQYGAGADQAAKYVNVLAAGSKFGAANVEQQAASILKAGTAAASAGVPIEELVGSIEMLGEKGIKGEIAGTGLKKFFLVLQTGAEATNPKVVGLSTALENLKAKVDAAEAKSTGGGAALLKKLFGEEAYSIAAILTSNTEKVQEYTDAVTGTSVAMEQAAINSDTLAARKAQLNNKITETGNQLMEKLNPSLGILVSWQTKLIGVLPDVIDFTVKYRATIMSAAMAYLAYIAYVNKAIIADKLKVFWTKAVIGSLRSLWSTLIANPWGAAAVAAGVLVGVLIDLKRRSDSLTLAQKALNKVHEEASGKLDTQKFKIEGLIKAAKDETRSLADRKKAVDELNRIIPGYNASIDETTEKYKASTSALNDYLSALTKRYELEGAKEMLADFGKEIAKLSMEEIEAQKKVEAARKERERLSSNNSPRVSAGGSMNAQAYEDMYSAGAEAGYIRQLEKVQDKIKETREARDELAKRFGTDIFKNDTSVEPKKPKTPEDDHKKNTSFGETEEERRERLKKEREAERERKAALKKDLDEKEAMHETSMAKLIALYTSGAIDYREYLERKKKLDADYLADQRSVYLKHNEEQSSEYAALLRKEQEVKLKHMLEMKKLSEKELESTRNSAHDTAQSDFYNPNSAVFQNDEVLKQKLLEADVKYLQAKLELYKGEPEKYMEIQQELEKRLAEDRLEKAKETAQALLDFQKEFGLQSGVIQEQAELAILKKLYDMGLISEEQYQMAVQAIRKKYRDADRQAKEKAREEELEEYYKTANEYDRMIFRLYYSFKYLFDDLDTSSKDFWQRLTAAASAAVETVSGLMGSMKSYMDACMNAEVASIENRYDKEIKAAGKNQVKVARLEAEKEKEVAKTRQKYNKRAMKMEVAQAIAQTATNALGAYGAMVKIPVVGPALAIAAAAAATAAGLIQVATIKKQHEAQAQGYFSGGFTRKDPDNRREAGVVHANEFVANHKAVANPALMPVLRLIDSAQKSNTVGSITAEDVSRAIGRTAGVGPGGDSTRQGTSSPDVNSGLEMIAGVTASTRQSLDRLSSLIEEGLPTYMVMDGDNGFHARYKRFQKTLNRPKP